ncbi:MAG: ureidoglycolate lyase [Alphaproteobacteria bacterium]
MKQLTPIPLTAESFKPFGDVIERDPKSKQSFNDGDAHRFHDLASVEAYDDPNSEGDGRAIISIASSVPKSLPMELHKMERHPLGSQAFIPLSDAPFLVVIAADKDGSPDTPIAFITNGKQGINYKAGTWHAVLTPLDKTSEFIVVDREGAGDNCEEIMLDHPFLITP